MYLRGESVESAMLINSCISSVSSPVPGEQRFAFKHRALYRSDKVCELNIKSHQAFGKNCVQSMKLHLPVEGKEAECKGQLGQRGKNVGRRVCMSVVRVCVSVCLHLCMCICVKVCHCVCVRMCVYIYILVWYTRACV